METHGKIKSNCCTLAKLNHEDTANTIEGNKKKEKGEFTRHQN
jgi:hypothetical protein